MASRKVDSIFSTAFSTYRLGRVVGQGGAGFVYEAQDDLNATVAVKVLDPSKTTAETRRRFKNEISFGERSSHPNIIKIIDRGVGVLRGSEAIFYVMPFYSLTLRRIVGGSTPAADRLKMFLSVVDGLEFAHSKRIWHRDLKPENILIDGAQNPVIADFGIAHFEEAELATMVETLPSSRLANFQYAAPEQLGRGGRVDGRADLYALGMILNELFTSHLPRGTNFTKIGDVDASLSYLDPLVDKMMHVDPESRPSSAEAVRLEISVRAREAATLSNMERIAIPLAPDPDLDEIVKDELVGLKDVDWQDGKLIFILDKAPSMDWVSAFRGIHGYSAIIGTEPERFGFKGNTATIPSRPDLVATLQTQFTNFLARANQGYRDEIRSRLTASRRAKEESIAAENRKSEQRLSALRNLGKLT